MTIDAAALAAYNAGVQRARVDYAKRRARLDAAAAANPDAFDRRVLVEARSDRWWSLSGGQEADADVLEAALAYTRDRARRRRKPAA